MFNKKTIRDIDVNQKRVLVRVDFNVPIKDGVIGDDTRIQAALPTIEYLIQHGAAVILCSHLGRPKDGPDPNLSLRPVAEHLATLLKMPVAFSEDCIGPAAEKASKLLKPGEVLVLENTRFHAEEEKNNPEMARQLASLADIYVNDAFGSAHRAHASTEGVTHFLPAVAGFLMEDEIQYLGAAIADPKHPFVVVLGGAKVSDKFGVIRNLLKLADNILIGGGIANSFLKGEGFEMGDSLVEDDVLATAKEFLDASNGKILLPLDLVIADKFEEGAAFKTIPAGSVPAGWRIMDIGPATIEAYSKVIKTAALVIWNGPMGVFELPAFAEGTFKIAKAIGESKAISVIGGGDSVAAIQQSGLASKITHISTGGGASLEMLEGVALPGLTALLDR